VRLLRPELAAIPHGLGAARVREQFWALFARPERLDPSAADIAADEFLRTYRSRSARVAFFAAARNIYLDEAHGEEGFWSRLAELRPPALFVWGDSDTLIPAAFGPHVADALPAARQVVLEECGHVPQVELPEVTNDLLRDQIESHRRLDLAADGEHGVRRAGESKRWWRARAG
jgi:pimeloyl-ACP methyl ester carboxylesterase